MAAKSPYHRPNLKQSLLDAAVGLIGEVGPQTFTLREVARRAGACRITRRIAIFATKTICWRK